MKHTVGALAVLVLLATVAIGQQSQVPSFPADANPSLVNNTSADTSANLPPAMAANQASTSAEAIPSFPADAKPSLANNTTSEMSNPVMDRDSRSGSQLPSFPTAAKPSQ